MTTVLAPRQCRRGSKRISGIALITILLLVSLLSILAATVVGITRSHGRIAQRSFESIRAEVRADSAIKLRLMRVGIPRRDSGAALPAGPEIVPAHALEQGVSVTVERENGRIDLNSADPDLLFAFFAANGFTEDSASSYARRIVDWRDADDDTDGGAERGDYAAAGLQYRPRNASFETPDEVRRVLGLGDLSDALLDGFTVYTHAISAVPIPSIPSVMNALRWADTRQLGGHRWLDDSNGRVGDAGDDYIGDIVRIRACVTREANLCRVSIVSLTGNPEDPFQVFAWHTELRQE